MSGRGRYGSQDPGDEKAQDTFVQHLADNTVVEGAVVKRWAAWAKTAAFHRINADRDRLKDEGWSFKRLEAMLAQAMNSFR
jgi:hypothetical protein